MEPDAFLERLPQYFEDYPRSELPRDAVFREILDDVGGLARANNLALLNAAVSVLPAGEWYVEVGSYKGASLVGALVENDAPAVAVDAFTFRDATREELELALARYGLGGRVVVLEGDAYDLLAAGALEDRRVGVYYWDAAHERAAVTAGLRAVEPWLAPGALLIVDDSDWERVASGVDDYLATQPRARRILTVEGSSRGAPHWWEGMQVLAWAY